MKSLLVIFALVFLNSPIGAQNLVPNPGFEDYNACPVGLSGIVYSPDYTLFPYCKDWTNPSNYSSPDYFNGCAPSASGVGIPDNIFGHQSAHSGNAYVGLYAWYSNYSGSAPAYIPYMEYVEAKLLSPMIADHRYLVSFWANLGDNAFAYAQAAINLVGVHFSNTQLLDTVAHSQYIAVSLDVADTNSYISDTAKWVQIVGVYKAKRGEQWISIGHFQDSTKTLKYTLLSGSSTDNKISYVYIDDVSVTECTNRIMTEPSDYHVTKGMSAGFSIVDTGSLSYQWQEKSGSSFVDLISSGIYSGVNTTSLNISNTSLAMNNYKYRCLALNGACTDTSVAATLLVDNLGINNMGLNDDIDIYPNPAKNDISITAPYQIQNIKIINALGQVLINQQCNNEHETVNITDLNKGIYIIKINNRYVQKIVKE